MIRVADTADMIEGVACQMLREGHLTEAELQRVGRACYAAWDGMTNNRPRVAFN
jgi:hypothetical protein